MMLSIPRLGLLLLLPLGLLLAACGTKEDAPSVSMQEEEGKHGDEEAGATYAEGKGILLSEETRKSLGLELAEVGEKAVASKLKLTAQVYRAASEASRTHGRERQGNAYATALVSSESAKRMILGQGVILETPKRSEGPGAGTLVKIETTQLGVLGKAEALLELPDPKSRLAVGEFVEVEVPVAKLSSGMLGIPKTAVLETSAGKFVYVLNGEFLLRTEIKSGAQNDDLVEVTDGLYEGDTIALKPAEALYLIELRATKGGGHCH